MAARNVSPGGALLRASRVFSIPPPLPRPTGNLSSQAIYNSDSATLPHPIYQSITTPQSSLARGDWGFKRPLPLRSTTKTSTPLIKVEAIDTYEHVTEFNSAADHTLSLQKWQEMGVPLSVPVKRENQGGFRNEGWKSVFEDDIDSTTDQARHEDNRWKFKGPWLAGMTEGDFNNYVVNEVRKRQLEFQNFIRTACANSLTTEARRTATATGITDQMAPPMKASDVTEEQFTEYVKTLRDERLNLYKLIRSFLDLPPAPAKKLSDRVLEQMVAASLGPRELNSKDLLEPKSPYADTGPPKTHPSAGLAYSRSSQHVYNHPVWGPQKHKRPVKARVVMPKGASTGNFAPVLGVGGFVTEVPSNSDFNWGGGRSRTGPKPAIPGLMNIEPEKVGGSKAFVHPTHARIDPKGRVLLTVVTADEDAVAVAEGTTEQIPLPPGSPVGPSGVTRSTGFNSIKNEESKSYGLRFSGEAALRPKSHAAAPTPSSPLRDDDAMKTLRDMLDEGNRG